MRMRPRLGVAAAGTAIVLAAGGLAACSENKGDTGTEQEQTKQTTSAIATDPKDSQGPAPEIPGAKEGGTLRLIPGQEGTQPKDVPLEAFFKKIIGIREKLRVLEQKINNHKALSADDKVDLQGYITRCYGSLTTFNVLFASKASGFVGSGGGEGE